MRALFIDHYDSFSFNVIDLLERAGVDDIKHIYFDMLTSEDPLDYDFVVLSPGPNRPEDALSSIEFYKRAEPKVPVLGICLGHQIIGYCLGGAVEKVKDSQHGSVKKIVVDSSSNLFRGVGPTLNVATYNSLCIYQNTLDGDSGFKVIATSEDGSVEALERNVMGKPYIATTQFHPESFLTELSMKIVQNFLERIKKVKP